MPLELKRFRITDTGSGSKLVVRLALQTGDTLARSHEWIEAKVELDPTFAQKPFRELRSEALQKLRDAIKEEIDHS